MRWPATNTDHHHGEKRKITEFAWCPTLVEDKYVWMESYWSYQEYWSVGDEWVEIQRYLK